MTLNIPLVLHEAPSKLEELAKKAVEAWKTHQIAEHKVLVAKAVLKLQHKEESATMQNAHAEADSFVQAAILECINAEAAAKVAEIEHQKAADEFVSVRKLASMQGDEMRAFGGQIVHSPRSQ